MIRRASADMTAPSLSTSRFMSTGRLPTDIHFSGTYQAGGMTIGYLRIPSFAPANPAQALTEITTEIAFFQQNTQGLVIDVMRNPGGGCFMLDLAARLSLPGNNPTI